MERPATKSNNLGARRKRGSIASACLSLTLLVGSNSTWAQSNEPDAPSTDDVSEADTSSLEWNMVNLKSHSFLTFTLQNDLFVGDDAGYTNGVGLTYTKGPFLEFNDENLFGYLNYLTKNTYIQTKPNKVRNVAHMFFQRMQTPEEITVSELQEDDVPYAGFLALQSMLSSWDKENSDQLSVFLGAVGPVTLGEQSQKIVHKIIGADEPRGWDNQMENELVFRVEALRVKKLRKNYGERYGYDVLGMGLAGIGTIMSDAQVGLAVRWGSNMEYSHSTFSLQSDRQVNSLALAKRHDFYLYLGGRIGYVANDILIDGNTFTDSHSVPLDHVQDQISTGAVWKGKHLSYVFQLTSSSSRTTISSSRDTFGALSITYPFQ